MRGWPGCHRACSAATPVLQPRASRPTPAPPAAFAFSRTRPRRLRGLSSGTGCRGASRVPSPLQSASAQPVRDHAARRARRRRRGECDASLCGISPAPPAPAAQPWSSSRGPRSRGFRGAGCLRGRSGGRGHAAIGIVGLWFRAPISALPSAKAIVRGMRACAEPSATHWPGSARCRDEGSVGSESEDDWRCSTKHLRGGMPLKTLLWIDRSLLRLFATASLPRSHLARLRAHQPASLGLRSQPACAVFNRLARAFATGVLPQQRSTGSCGDLETARPRASTWALSFQSSGHPALHIRSSTHCQAARLRHGSASPHGKLRACHREKGAGLASEVDAPPRRKSPRTRKPTPMSHLAEESGRVQATHLRDRSARQHHN